jgi:hypothetical protein
VKRLIFILFALLAVTAFTFAVSATHPPGNDIAEAVLIGEATVVNPEAVLEVARIAALSSNMALPAYTINQTWLPESLMTNAGNYRIIKPRPVIDGVFAIAPDYYLIL